MEGAGGKRLGSLPRALQHPEMNHSHCLSTYCNMNVWYLRRLSDLWNHMQLVRRHPGKKLRLKRGASDVWKRAACPQRSIKAAGWCSGQPGGGRGTTSNTTAKLAGLKSISVFTLVHLQLNKRTSPVSRGRVLSNGVEERSASLKKF